jgi:creatinine amidohydrolase
VTSYFTAGHEVIAEVLRTQRHLMHACGGETSMAPAAFPGLVRAEKLPQAVGPAIPLQSEDTSPVYRSLPFYTVAPNGTAGDARTAASTSGSTRSK